MSIEDMPSDKELFEGSVSAEQPEPVAETPAVQATDEQAGQPRDENGRFAAKVETPPAEQAQASQQVEQPKTPEQDAQVPSWRLREIREEMEKRVRDRETELERERQQRLRYEAQLRQLQQAQPQTPPVDMFADPDKWQELQRQQLAGMANNLRFETSEMFARQTLGDQKVDEAMKWLETNPDPGVQARITNSRHPYGELLKAYEERKVLQEIGNDVTAYRAKLEEQLLNDPAFLQKVGDKIRSQSAQPQQNGQRPATVTQLPPSLARAPAGGSHTADMSEADMSDAALFRYARS
jgi:hypothetical protein